jgi:hypothetical protein
MTAWRKANPDKWKTINNAWHKANPEDNKAKANTWKAANEERVKNNKHKWKENNRDKVNAYQAKRRAKKLHATPPWLTKEQLEEIRSYYSLAKELQWLSEEPLEVDHIVPLQGENVSGLHVPWNLQILPKKLNLIKHNN